MFNLGTCMVYQVNIFKGYFLMSASDLGVFTPHTLVLCMQHMRLCSFYMWHKSKFDHWREQWRPLGSFSALLTWIRARSKNILLSNTRDMKHLLHHFSPFNIERDDKKVDFNLFFTLSGCWITALWFTNQNVDNLIGTSTVAKMINSNLKV